MAKALDVNDNTEHHPGTTPPQRQPEDTQGRGKQPQGKALRVNENTAGDPSPAPPRQK
ncbi:MAG: hypothetical protein WDN25_20715 [Acetobacteraceae bacterium]